MTALRIDCRNCDWSEIVRYEEVSDYAECGMGTSLSGVARTLKRDHRVACGGSWRSPIVVVEEGEWDAWNQEFQKTGGRIGV